MTYHFMATAPCSFYVEGESKRYLAGDTFTVEDEYVAKQLQDPTHPQFAHLRLLSVDGEPSETDNKISRGEQILNMISSPIIKHDEVEPGDPNIIMDSVMTTENPINKGEVTDTGTFSEVQRQEDLEESDELSDLSDSEAPTLLEKPILLDQVAESDLNSDDKAEVSNLQDKKETLELDTETPETEKETMELPVQKKRRKSSTNND